MNEQDQIIYDELFDLSHHELTVKVMELEDVMDANDKLMQTVAMENAEICGRLEETEAQMKLLEAANASMLKQLDAMRHYYRGRHAFRDVIKHGRGIGNPEYYFDVFKDRTKEDVLMLLMEREQLMFEEGLLEQASGI